MSCWFLALFFVYAARIAGLGSFRAEAEAHARCKQMRTDYDIKPGKSFGSLPVSQHNSYLRLQCHRFFCEPHPLAGKGVFDCIELKDPTTPDPQQV